MHDQLRSHEQTLIREKPVFPDKMFPLQQGALDSLCGVYSVLNCMNALGELDSHAEACDRFRKVAPKIERPIPAVLEGFDPGTKQYSDVWWFGKRLARREILKPRVKLRSSKALATQLDDSPAGGIIYFRDWEDVDLTHYTFVKKRQTDGAFPLWDSYGFSMLQITPEGAFVDCRKVEVTHFWEAVCKG